MSYSCCDGSRIQSNTTVNSGLSEIMHFLSTRTVKISSNTSRRNMQSKSFVATIFYVSYTVFKYNILIRFLKRCLVL